MTPGLAGREPAINGDRLAGDEAGYIARQVNGKGTHLRQRPGARHGMHGTPRLHRRIINRFKRTRPVAETEI